LKDQIQQHLCDELGLTVTVAHYPALASKYNPIERRLFSQIRRNWAAEPLICYDKTLQLIRKTTTTTGLRVRSYLDRKGYPLKVKPSAERLRQLRITRPELLPKWNYTIAPLNVNTLVQHNSYCE
jgi:Rhodopirellula transposase DDE domain